MAEYRIALNTSAYPGRQRGELIEADPDDPATVARVEGGVLVRVGAAATPEEPAEAPTAPEERPRGRRGGRGASGDDTAAEGSQEDAGGDDRGKRAEGGAAEGEGDGTAAE